MDYLDLTNQLMQSMYLFRKCRPNVDINESIQGGAFILQYLLERKEAVLPSEISNEMEISTARIAAVLNNMEKKGLINREINKSDRRQILVTLTPEGLKFAEERQQEVVGHVSQMLQSLGERDAVEFIRILNRIVSLQINRE